MRKLKRCAWCVTAGLAIACNPDVQNRKASWSKLSIEITNPLSAPRNETVVIDDQKLFIDQWKPQAATVQNYPAEMIDSDQDGLVDKLIVNIDFAPNQTISIKWPEDIDTTRAVEKKVQAEISHKVDGEWKDRKYIGGRFQNVDFLRAPDQNTDHSYFIRYEGPGIENELIAYRFYLDWRNAIDIFGKKVDTLVLHTIGQDGYDSYHESAPWGMDILKAGKSLGIGSIGQSIDGRVEHFVTTDSVTCAITQNENLSATVETNYYGWKTTKNTVDLRSQVSMVAGDRAISHTLSFSSPIEGFCTGIVKHDSVPTSFSSLVGSSGWAYLATYGKQSLADDNLGLAIIYNAKDVSEVVDSAYDHLILFKPSKRIKYLLLGAWEQENNGVKSLEEFQQYLEEKVARLNQPLVVSVK